MSVLRRRIYAANQNFDDNYALAFFNKGNVGTAGQKIILDGFTASSFNEEFTIEIRHRLTSWDGNVPSLFHINFGNSFIHAVYLNSSQLYFRWVFALPNSGGNRRNLVRNFTLGQFNHFVFTFKKNTIAKLFVNGVKTELSSDISIAESETLISSELFTSSGNIYNPTGFARGVRVFVGYAASDLDAAALYNSDRKNIQPVPSGMEPFLVRDFPFNQKSGRTVFDNKGTAGVSLNNGFTNLGWTDSEVEEGGGAWVDVSGIN